LLAVGDDEVVGAELALLAVESRHRFAFARAADQDSPASEPVQVETMQRMPELEQRQIRRVHHVADGSDPTGAQPLLNMKGRGTDVHALDHAGDIAGTPLRVLDVDPRRQLTLPGRLRRWHP